MSTITELKHDYVKYYEDVPVQRYAAMYIGRDEDTIIRWRKDDPTFAESIMRAKAEWIRKRVIATKAEFALERLEKNIFSEKSSLPVEQASYEQAIANSTINPNDPKWLAISQQITDQLMEETKQK